MVDLSDLLADLADESAQLDALVAACPRADWARPTPAPGWTHRAPDRPPRLDRPRRVVGRHRPGGVLRDGDRRARTLRGWWTRAPRSSSPRRPSCSTRWRAGRTALADALAAVPAGEKLPWYGTRCRPPRWPPPGSWRPGRTAQDVADALDVVRPDSRPAAARGAPRRPHPRARLRRARPGGTDGAGPGRAGRARTAPRGRWGPADAADRVTGPARDFCLLVTQRRHRADLALVATGTGRRRVARRGAGLRRAAGGRPGAGRRERGTGMIRIGNASGFYGDRFTAWREMLDGGELDVLTGDYLAELTMLILARDRLRDPDLGYAKTFLRQLETCLGTALDRGVRIVTNAGGLNPAGLAAAIEKLADRLGLPARVGYVEGDTIQRPDALSANAYLGAFGIAACLRRRRGRGGHRPGHRRLAGGRPGHRPATGGAATTSTRWPGPPSPGTSSSAAHRSPAATSASSPSCPTAVTGPDSRSPRSTPTARRWSPSIRAPAARSPWRRSPPNCSTRSAGRRTSARTWSPDWTR